MKEEKKSDYKVYDDINSPQMILDSAYNALNAFHSQCAVIRSVEDLGSGHWIISKDEDMKIKEILSVLLDCGAEPDF